MYVIIIMLSKLSPAFRVSTILINYTMKCKFLHRFGRHASRVSSKSAVLDSFFLTSCIYKCVEEEACTSWKSNNSTLAHVQWTVNRLENASRFARRCLPFFLIPTFACVCEAIFFKFPYIGKGSTSVKRVALRATLFIIFFIFWPLHACVKMYHFHFPYFERYPHPLNASRFARRCFSSFLIPTFACMCEAIF